MLKAGATDRASSAGLLLAAWAARDRDQCSQMAICGHKPCHPSSIPFIFLSSLCNKVRLVWHVERERETVGGISFASCWYGPVSFSLSR